MKRTLLFLLFVVSGPLSAQITFQSTWGGIFQDGANDVIETLDHQYLVIGSTREYGVFGCANMRIMKFDQYGDTMWTKTFSDSIWSGGARVIQRSDSGFVLLGMGDYGSNNILMISTDKLGNVQWSKFLGDGQGPNTASSFKQTSDGGYVITGFRNDSASASQVGYLMRANSAGDTLWTKSLTSGLYSTILHDVIIAANGDFVVTGYTTHSFGAYFGSIFLARTDSAGTELWQRSYPDGHGHSIIQTPDGGFAITGQANYNGIVLYKINSLGDTSWTKNYGGKVGNALIQANDGSYVITGSKIRDTLAPWPYFFEDLVVLNIDTLGNLNYERTYGDTLDDSGVRIRQTSDGGYIIAGYWDYVINAGIGPLQPGDDQALLLKLDSIGLSTDIHYPVRSGNALWIYPNPVSDKLFVEYTSHIQARYYVCDMVGRILTEGMLQEGKNEIPVSALARGIYHLYTSGAMPMQAKFIKSK